MAIEPHFVANRIMQYCEAKNVALILLACYVLFSYAWHDQISISNFFPKSSYITFGHIISPTGMLAFGLS